MHENQALERKTFSKDQEVQSLLKICLEGYRFFFISLIPLFLSLYFSIIGLAVLFSILSAWVLWFFRDPNRTIPNDQDVLVSPADGRVIEISKGIYPRFCDEQVTKVSIFMSVFNVHINRIVMDGVIEKIVYNKGKFIAANRPKASMDNEQNALFLKTHQNERIVFVQIAGLIARRIMTEVNENMSVQKGQKYGLIRFGSRVDVYLPMHFDVKVKLDDKVKGGQSMLAKRQ